MGFLLQLLRHECTVGYAVCYYHMTPNYDHNDVGYCDLFDYDDYDDMRMTTTNTQAMLRKLGGDLARCCRRAGYWSRRLKQRSSLGRNPEGSKYQDRR